MIVGSKYWNDKDKWYIQTNNPTEEILRKINKIDFLETCGPSAAVNCLAAHGYDLSISCPGNYKPQPEEVLSDWFNDPRNYKLLKKARPNLDPRDIPGGRVPQYYPVAAHDVFGQYCEFMWLVNHFQLSDLFKKGYSIQLCLLKPSHYIAGVAFDLGTSEIIYNDSWPSYKKGFNERLSGIANLEKYAVVYPPPEVVTTYKRRVLNA